jgi:hypothetical protein
LLDFSTLTPRERLAAEQAILILRELDKAADDAPHGQGFACLEQVALAQGMQHLRDMVAASLSARDEAQKKGSVSAAAGAVAKRSSRHATRAMF